MKKILLGIGIVLIVFVAVGFMLPRSAHVERSITINSTPEKVFGYVNNFREFNTWSPWAKRDPETQYRYSGPDAGVGATMAWQSSDPSVGKGSQRIIASEPGKRVVVALDFDDHHATAYYVLVPEGDITRVTWGFDSDLGMNPIARYFGLFFDKMIGADYEQGLGFLKARVESA